MWGQGIADDDDEKRYAHVAGGNVFYTTPASGGKHSFFKEEHTICTGKQSFHKSDTIFNLFANNFLGGEGISGLLREASPPKGR